MYKVILELTAEEARTLGGILQLERMRCQKNFTNEDGGILAPEVHRVVKSMIKKLICGVRGAIARE